jgi:hypothetical protein
MNETKFFKFATLGLLLLNLAVLTFFFLTKPKHNPPPRGNHEENVHISILKLDKIQEESFLKLANDHERQMNNIGRKQADLLVPYFEKLNTNDTLINNSEILLEYQNLEADKINITYQHFEDIKEMLRDDQLKDFKPFIDQIMNKILKSEGPPRREPPHRKQ